MNIKAELNALYDTALRDGDDFAIAVISNMMHVQYG